MKATQIASQCYLRKKEAAHGATETQLASYGCFLTLLLLLLS
jgi:hypothetical protein